MMFCVNTWALRFVVSGVAAWLALAGSVRADAVRNGNELALNFSSSKGAEKEGFKKNAEGKLHTWRFLKITSITQPSAGANSARLVTVEPSSDMKVLLTTNMKLSLKLAAGLQVGDCVAARGRVQSVGGEDGMTIVVDPATLDYKDKPKPERGKELLKEVDPRAN